MTVPIWVTGNNLGIAKHLDPCNKTVQASGATSYSLISGQLPSGLTLSPTGVISGEPKVANIIANRQGTRFTFTIRATGNGYSDRTFTLTVISNNLYVPEISSMPRCRIGTDFLQYQILRGNVDIPSGMFWRLDEGELPPGTTLHPDGILEIVPGYTILPFQKEQFIRPTVDPSVINSLSQKFWDDWLATYLSLPRDKDYQFRLTLSNGQGPVQLSLTCRILITTPPTDSDWFQINSNFISVKPLQQYILFSISEPDYLYWESDSDLGSVFNGSVSELEVSAVCASKKELFYNIKPLTNSQLPQQLTLLDNGLITGRISFRCHQDDPVSVPVNDDYVFTVRASTKDEFTYSEKTFNLHVIRYYDKPYNNIWVRSFPAQDQRNRFNKIINDPTFFPDEFLYRPNDKYYGKIRHLRFLLAPGIPPAPTEDYYFSIIKNHYDKTVLFSEPRNAVSYDRNLRIKYEVVYVPIVDLSQITNVNTNSVIAQPNIIDLRPQINNFFLKDQQVYYEFEPNGIENMRRIIGATASVDTGLLPTWMTSIQPIPNMVGQFYNPPGFVAGVVLAYTIAGTSSSIVYRLRQSGINFNDFKFEFDRYELDDTLSRNFDVSTDSFLSSGSETTFDNGATKFENGSTRFNQNLDFSTEPSDRDPDFGTKYLKFPKTGVFI